MLRTIRTERSTLQWWLRHRSRYPDSSAAPLIRCQAIGIHTPPVVCAHARVLVNALHVLHRIDSKIAALARARYLASWPPHHALWMCIHGLEAANWQDRDSGGNGHYGGLQMHPGWGYGTSEYASDDSQWTIEWAAERGYAASHYSHVWLMGQWAHYQCLRYA